jgi:hypothetical protein
MRTRKNKRNAYSEKMGGVFDWFKKKKHEEERAGIFERLQEIFESAPPPPSPPSPPPRVNYYAILGVPPNATADQIRAAYRELAKRWHPDVRPGDHEAIERFRLLSEAHDVLMDPEKRAKHDRELAAAGIIQSVPPHGLPSVPSPPHPREERAVIIRSEAPIVPVARPPAPSPPVPPQAHAPKTIAEIFEMIEEPSFQEIFVPSPEERPRVQAPPMQPPSFVRPAPWAPSFASQPVGPIPLPTISEMEDVIRNTWPLDEIFGIVRENRRHPEFLSKGFMVVMPVAGFDPREGLEYELADRLGVPRWIIQDYARRGLLTTGLWSDVFNPLLDVVHAILDRIKPPDIPGRFFLNFDETRTKIELVYYEKPGPEGL